MGGFNTPQLLETFTPREVEILYLMSEGLTNQEIARRLFLSLDTIKGYNQVIFGKLGVNNRTRAIRRARESGLLESQDISPSQKPLNLKHNLPAPTGSFIGRKKEIIALRRLITARDTRLVTILGPGGVGKTSLGLQVAYHSLSRFEDGVFFVSLAPLDDAGLAQYAVAQALGIFDDGSRPVKELLEETLRERQVLLLLDNFEHLLPAALLVSSLLAVAPGLKILVTSRAPLGIYGEHLCPLSSLSLPDPRNLPSVEDLVKYEAIHLFVERAGAVQPEFTLRAENSADVVKICLRLDGLPLAIELAAARLHRLPLAEMAALFDGREGLFPFELFDKGPIDAPARHRTLRNAIAWSYDLLVVDEKALFRRMGVFAGGCTQEAVAGVCLDEPPITSPARISDISARLESLVEKNLVTQSIVQGEHRYGMLETIRAYALEQLNLSDEDECIRQRHAEYYLALVKDSIANINSLSGLGWINRLKRERYNLRAVLSWSLATSSSFPLEQRLIKVVKLLGEMHLPFSERRQWTEKALLRLDEKSSEPFDHRRRLLQANMLIDAGGGTAYFQGDYPAAGEYLKKGLSILQDLGDKHRLANALVVYSWTLLALGKSRQAKARAEQALLLGKELEDSTIIAHILNYLGSLAWIQGSYDQAESLYTESQACFKDAQDSFWEAIMFLNIGQVAQDRGDQVRAREFFQEGLRRCWKVTGMWGIGRCLIKVAQSATVSGQYLRAVRLFAAAEALYHDFDIAIEPWERSRYQTYLALARDGLDEANFAAAWAEGQALTLENAVAEALTQF
jgi:predicted ATPase/DNA-binding CsgD family transcriptional regulator